MKKIILTLIILVLLLVGCNNSCEEVIEEQPYRQSSFDVCVEHGGIPIRSWAGGIKDCVFKDEVKK